MSLINPASTVSFKSVDSLFARVRKRLGSFDAAGLLDEGDWYHYIKEIAKKIGTSVYDEREAFISIKGYKGPLPEDFSYIYAAYKAHGWSGDSKQTVFPQKGFVFYIEDTYQPYRKCKNCAAAKIEYVDGMKYTTRTYIEGEPYLLNFEVGALLKLTGSVLGGAPRNSPNLTRDPSMDEIAVQNGMIYTNFSSDCIYMKYFALPLDPDSGLPMIAGDTFTEKALEDYIIYRVLEDFWFNGSVPDMDNRYKVAKMNYEDSLKMALYYAKLPGFQTAINKIRFDRKNLRIYQQIDGIYR